VITDLQTLKPHTLFTNVQQRQVYLATEKTQLYKHGNTHGGSENQAVYFHWKTYCTRKSITIKSRNEMHFWNFLYLITNFTFGMASGTFHRSTVIVYFCATLNTRYHSNGAIGAKTPLHVVWSTACQQHKVCNNQHIRQKTQTQYMQHFK